MKIILFELVFTGKLYHIRSWHPNLSLPDSDVEKKLFNLDELQRIPK